MANSLEYKKKYYQENKERILERHRKYNLEHKEQIAEWGRRYYAQNKAHKQAVGKKYYQKNKDRILKRTNGYWYLNREVGLEKRRKYYKANRYLMKAGRCGMGKSLVPIIQRVYEDNIKKFGTLTCYLCFNPVEFGKDQLEHRVPVSRGGTHTYENLGISCAKCNTKKGKKTEEEYRCQIQ